MDYLPFVIVIVGGVFVIVIVGAVIVIVGLVELRTMCRQAADGAADNEKRSWTDAAHAYDYGARMGLAAGVVSVFLPLLASLIVSLVIMICGIMYFGPDSLASSRNWMSRYGLSFVALNAIVGVGAASLYL